MMIKKQFNAEPLHRLRFSVVQFLGLLRYAVYKRMQENPGVKREKIFTFRNKDVERLALYFGRN